MMEYRVIRDFADARDKGHIYHAGDIFPRAGVASESRIAELSGYANRIGSPLIEAVVPDPIVGPNDSAKPAEPAEPAEPNAEASDPIKPAQDEDHEQEKPKAKKTTRAKAAAQKS